MQCQWAHGTFKQPKGRCKWCLISVNDALFHIRIAVAKTLKTQQSAFDIAKVYVWKMLEHIPTSIWDIMKGRDAGIGIYAASESKCAVALLTDIHGCE